MTLARPSNPATVDRDESKHSVRQPAGLRIATAGGEPTGTFVAVEMAILVIVTALAMVSIIVAGMDAAETSHADAARARAGDRSQAGHRAPLPIDGRLSIEPEARRTDVATR